MKLFVTGAAGQLGRDLLALSPDAVGSDVSDLDLTDGRAVLDRLTTEHPDVVIHGAAYTAVDAAEADEERAHLVNAVASAHVATAAAAVGARVLAVSTDYVFSGEATAPYEPHDPTGPRSAYGRTKLAGELAVREILPDTGYVVRTAWVYGAGGKNIVKTMAGLSRTRETVSVVDDQRGSPTWSRHLAQGLLELAAAVDRVPAGIYHATGGGDTTWHGFTQAVFEELGLDPARVLPISTAEYPLPAHRPAYSVLSPAAWVGAGLTPLPHWREALHEAMTDPDVGPALRGE